jgi:uncharacterized alkaline shock family protein YloU
MMSEDTLTSEQNEADADTPGRDSIGRVEVAPSVLTTIAHYATLDVEGVNKMAATPADVGQLFRRHVARNEGVILDYSDGNLIFDIFVLMDPHVNVRETSQKLQTAIIEAIDKMVGIPVDTVNIHVEDVVYNIGETA